MMYEIVIVLFAVVGYFVSLVLAFFLGAVLNYMRYKDKIESGQPL